MKHFIFSLFSFLVLSSCGASNPSTKGITKVADSINGYWQQHVDYSMDIDMDVNNYQYKGKQKLVYTNNSPDVLNRVYYHLFFNAFQPGSEMDVRSRTIKDPSPKIADRISKLQPNEIGYIKVNGLKQNGTSISYETVGTVLEVKLNQPIQPGEKVTFDMDFDAQVPVQIRRSGRDNEEGVALSMSQWYPKLAEYDDEGWHADPYIGREFHGVWGNFDVKLTIDKNYVVGGTGYLQGEPTKKSGKKTHHFKAPNVHDFTWAADPDFIHDTFQMPNGPLLHFYYKKDLEQAYLDNWKKLPAETAKLMDFFSTHVGQYPYKQYSVIQGGDGGMEYAMCTLITGKRKYGSLLGVTAHELAHTWFQFLLASNESKHEWMDEGFTSYISALAMNSLKDDKNPNPLSGSYRGYIGLANSGYEQPLTTHSDRYKFNQVYGAAAYSKGAVFLAQLGYVIGDDNLDKTIKKYFYDFSFKHPKPFDIIRTAERVTDFELDWYFIDFAQTTNTIDYGINTVEGNTITLDRIGLMPMPIDLSVTYTDGTTEDFYIPLQMMRGEKPTSATIINDWAWAMPTYSFDAKKAVKSVEIDHSKMMADVNRANNVFTLE
ncbi:M1 family metallopeptidase [uncultured Winogradskyella sp.]|mgnify:CR=1 FL=1|uniref:M1 family metallopeptidase n=1 Tax=uncultured Winogradskyella sp. TaxID=395353 RepID=UPI00263A04D3|nr:M1 family metallopeptidase [uncultured Winogradskyella sp.]|tara:strand:- start:463 stop:2265 length:1803 start_codon:yes stop_codon:yes gene_type:complete